MGIDSIALIDEEVSHDEGEEDSDVEHVSRSISTPQQTHEEVSDSPHLSPSPRLTLTYGAFFLISECLAISLASMRPACTSSESLSTFRT